jgi:hypothetical protein
MHILFSTGYDPSRDTIFGYYFIFLSRIEFLFTCQSMILQITSIFHHYELGLISGYFVFLGNIIMTFVWLVHRRIILIIYFNFTPIRVYFSFYLHGELFFIRIIWIKFLRVKSHSSIWKERGGSPISREIFIELELNQFCGCHLLASTKKFTRFAKFSCGPLLHGPPCCVFRYFFFFSKLNDESCCWPHS